MQIMMMMRLLIPLVKHPNFPDDAKKKWPRHFVFAQAPIIGPKGFYMFQLPKSNSKMIFLLGIGITVVIAFMLFSIWPLWLKIGIWYVSFYTLVALVKIKLSVITNIGWVNHREILCLVIPLPLRA